MDFKILKDGLYLSSYLPIAIMVFEVVVVVLITIPKNYHFVPGFKNYLLLLHPLD